MKLSRRLYDARKELCREKNLARIIIAGRIPGYHQHADKLTAREYIDKVVEKAIYDPVLTAQLSNGFSVQGLIPNYLPSDTRLAAATRPFWNGRTWTTCRVPNGGSTTWSNRFGSASSSTRCGGSEASTNLPSSASSFSIRRRTTSAISCCSRSCSRRSCCPASKATRPGRPPGSWPSSRRSTWSSSPKWRSSTT